MNMKSKLVLITCILLLSNFFIASAQYAELVGKWVEINGPRYWKTLGVCLDERACDRLICVIEQGGQSDFELELYSYRTLRIKNHTAAMVLEAKLNEGKAKVLLLNGLHKGFSGWIPIEWLANNSERPKFSKR